VAYINTSGRPSRRERSERRDSDVHKAGVYWPMGVIKFAGGGRLGCGGAGAMPPRYGTGYFRDFPNASVQAYCLGVSILRF
jgi:hypothetical protein